MQNFDLISFFNINDYVRIQSENQMAAHQS